MNRRSASVSRFSRLPASHRHSVPINNANRRSASVASSRPAPAPAAEPNFNYSKKVIHNKKDLTSFSDLQIPESTQDVNVSYNKLTDFTGLNALKSLESLDVSHNRIKSLAGFPHLPRLRSINVLGNEIMKNQFIRIALVVVCPTLRVINGDPVRPNELRIVKEYNADHAALLRSGWNVAHPAPPPAEVVKIKKALSAQLVTKPAKSRAQPKIVTRTPRKQSEVYSEILAHQDAELKALSEQMNKLKK